MIIKTIRLEEEKQPDESREKRKHRRRGSRIWSGWCGNLGSEKGATPNDYNSNPLGIWRRSDDPYG